MSRIVILDAGPLGRLAHPAGGPGIRTWIRTIRNAGAYIAIPEVIDYEVRRELIRARKRRSLDRLDDLKARLVYVPINTSAMLVAAEYWVRARRHGRPTADPAALDVDVILAAQAATLVGEGHDVTVATTNVGHLGQFVDARPWAEISR